MLEKEDQFIYFYFYFYFGGRWQNRWQMERGNFAVLDLRCIP